MDTVYVTAASGSSPSDDEYALWRAVQVFLIAAAAAVLATAYGLWMHESSVLFWVNDGLFVAMALTLWVVKIREPESTRPDSQHPIPSETAHMRIWRWENKVVARTMALGYAPATAVLLWHHLPWWGLVFFAVIWLGIGMLALMSSPRWGKLLPFTGNHFHTSLY
jgi:hypothetical protein